MIQTQRRGRLIVLSGPSGVGKTTVLLKLLERLPNLVRSVSATTRPPRTGERHGVDYHFLSREEFDRREAAGEFLESARVFGHAYGTPRAPIERELAAGRSAVLAIDVEGADQVRSRFSPVTSFFLLPSSLEVLRERLRARPGGSSEAELKERLARASQEIARQHQYDYAVVNDELDRAVEIICRRLQRILETGGPPLLS